MKRQVILASTSTYRRNLLERLGIPFHCEAPDVDEALHKAEESCPATLARTLARMKSVNVARRFHAAIVIGSDQVCAFDREVLGKPGTAQSARQQLRRLSGQAHTLHTAVCVTCNDASEEFLVSTNLWMRELTDDEIERYVEADDPTQCAGSYRIENAGISLFHKIDCEDFTAIVGLPLMQLTEVLRRYGIPVP